MKQSQKHCILHVVLIILLIQLTNCTVTTNIVKSLPGFPGDLPFKLETGYIGVGENDELQLFYYFIESESDPSSDPLVLWLTGGPGCSGFFGLVYEFGPLMFNHSTPFPSLVLRPYSWTKVASIIFIDSPVGTGFSYSTTPEGYHTSDIKATKDSYTFLRKWLLNHPRFIKNHLYIGGDSYAGISAPLLASEIVNGNEDGLHPHMALKGYIIGNARAYMGFGRYDYEKIQYANKMGIISDEVFELAKSSCNGEYVNPDPDNHRCLHALDQIEQCTNLINDDHILEPKCNLPELMKYRLGILVPEDISIDSLLFRQEDKWCRMDTYERSYDNHEHVNGLGPNFTSPELMKSGLGHSLSGDVRADDSLLLRTKGTWCRKDDYWRSYVWSNDEIVQEALHVRKGTIREWIRCKVGSLSYEFKVKGVLEHHQFLINRGYRFLAYSGDHDMCVPYTITLKWIHDLNLTIDKSWRPWTVDSQVAGYTETYNKNGRAPVTFATLMGAGHTGAEYKPKEFLAMVSRWLSRSPL